VSISISLPNDCIRFRPDELNDYTEVFRIKPGGIYAFYSEDGTCLYVGKSIDLRARIRNHLSSSPFRSEIANIEIYFCNNEAERDIYETFAINAFGAVHNRDKVGGKRPLRSDVELLEELTEHLRDLTVLRSDIVYEIKGLDACYGKPGKRRTVNNFTGELSEAFGQYLDELEYFKSEVEPEYNEEKAELHSRLIQLDDEISEIKAKIKELSEKVRT
jgi:hypothetical protein